MSDWNTEQARYKAKKLGIVEQQPIGGNNKRNRKKKLWRVWGPHWRVNKEYVCHRAASQELCEQWIEKQRRSYYVGLQHTAQEQDRRKRLHEERISKYRIEGPDHE